MPNPVAREPSGLALSLRLRRPGFELALAVTLEPRGVTALFGSSGSGKTTALRLLSGLERGSGSLFAFGECWQDDERNIFVPPHERGIGYVFQEASLFSHLLVRENLAYAEKRRRSFATGLGKSSLIELFELAPLLERMPSTLSGGERQRVAIARALLSSPRLLLMDEPLSALDERRKAEVLPYLERLRDELSIPLVYVSHALEEVARLSDRIVLLEQGRVTATGPTLELLSRLDLPLSSGDQAGVVVEAAVACHDLAHSLTRLDFPGGSLWVSRVAREPGEKLRARVLARDVSIALHEPGPSSILNVLAAEVLELSDEGPDRINVRLGIGPERVPLLSRVTRRSRDALGLAPGLAVFAQVKSVALVSAFASRPLAP